MLSATTFVTTHPEALAAAAAKLESLGSALAAHNAAVAAPTTGVVPAAADVVSALQAAQFAAYATRYQQVSAEATAINEMFVNTLRTSAGSYTDTEAANSAAVGPSSSGLAALLGGLTGTGSAGLSSNIGNIVNVGAGNWCAAASGLLGLAGGGLLPAAASEVDAAASADTVAGRLDEAVKASALGPVISANSGGVPASARVGQASSVGGLSVPPSWAGEAAAAVSPRTAALVSAGSSAAAPHSAPLSTMPAGMPSVARVGKAAGVIAPRYGVKPTVMPKPVGL